MTTPLTAPERLPWWRYLGPWPLRPITFGFIIFVLIIVSSVSAITFDTLAQYIGTAVTAAIVCGLILRVADRYFPGWVRRMSGYLTVVLIMSVTIVLLRNLIGTSITWDFVGPTGNFVLATIRNALVALIILAILGVSSRRLQHEIKQTQQALDVVRAQAAALLEADETVRQQVAAALHDRVQAGLIGACMQLQSIVPRMHDRDADLITRVIDSLEEIRGLDVRRAVRSLSPNLREVDLQSAIQELSETYGPAMTTTLEINAENAPYEVKLGAYRIIEQSLLNSAIHGHATHCEVSIHTHDRALTVTIVDDGTGLPAESTPGLGSTLISTWCRTLDGSWSRESRADGGAIVTARLAMPLPATSTH